MGRNCVTLAQLYVAQNERIPKSALYFTVILNALNIFGKAERVSFYNYCSYC